MNNDEILNICVSVNSKYVKYLYVMLASVFINNESGQIRVFVLNRDLTSADQELLDELGKKYDDVISFVKVDEKKLEIFPSTIKFPLEAYFRLLIPELLPLDIHRVLYLDVDIIVQKPLKELYRTDFDGSLFCCCRDMSLWYLDNERQIRFNRKDDLRYFNSGVMLLNLDGLREIDLLKKSIAAGYDLGFDLRFADQEILNYLFYKDAKYLNPFVFNRIANKRYIHASAKKESVGFEIEDAVVLHYAGYNPWSLGPKDTPYKIWWEYAKKTPIYQNLMEEHIKRFEEYVANDLEEERARRIQNEDISFIMEYAFKLKGSNAVLNYVRKNGRFILYGLGKMAEVFEELLGKNNFDSEIWDVVDRNRQGTFNGLTINNDFSFMEKDTPYTVVSTPTFHKREIVCELEDELPSSVQVMSLRRFLRIIVEENEG